VFITIQVVYTICDQQV